MSSSRPDRIVPAALLIAGFAVAVAAIAVGEARIGQLPRAHRR
jgi:hypothetical protein